MDILVPFSITDPKSRLQSILDTEERKRFAMVMLTDVCAQIVDAGYAPTILATEEIDVEVDTIIDERPLSEAVNAHVSDNTAVVMADLALVRSKDLQAIFEIDAEIVIAPGLGGGTNVLVIRHPDFSVDYHGTSYLDHLRMANKCGASVHTVDSFRLAIDIDEPTDLAEVLIHSDRAPAKLLQEFGITLSSENGRVTVTRSH